MESSRQRHDASENVQTLPQVIKNKSALPTGNPTAAIELPEQLHLPQQTQQPRQQLHLPRQTKQPSPQP